jgi:hypothetical protein
MGQQVPVVCDPVGVVLGQTLLLHVESPQNIFLSHNISTLSEQP